MTASKTNERPGTRAVLRHCRMSATKARQVLDLIRGEDVDKAAEIVASTEREAADVIGKVLASAVANAVHNDYLDAEDLYISACYADEGATLKRWRPRARGRASRIRKRTCHITIIVSRMPDERLERRRSQRAAVGAQRSRRVSESRRRADLSGRLSRRRTAASEAAEAEAADQAAAAEAEALEAKAAQAESNDTDEVVDDTANETETTDGDEGAETEASADDDTTADADDTTADADDNTDSDSSSDEEKGK
jgi:large subunit ribosomal protein L22